MGLCVAKEHIESPNTGNTDLHDDNSLFANEEQCDGKWHGSGNILTYCPAMNRVIGVLDFYQSGSDTFPKCTVFTVFTFLRIPAW